jgi:hypothetical protein
MKRLSSAVLLLLLTSVPARAQVNAGTQAPDPNQPFTMTQVTTLNLPWRIAFLPDGRMLITEKVGGLWIVTQQGEKTQVANVPAVVARGQGGMLGVYLSPKYATDHNIYLTYSEPGASGEPANFSSLAMSRARLAITEGANGTPATAASLEGLEVLWRQMPRGAGGQFGAAIAFSPDGQYLFLSVGDRQRMTPAQDPDQSVGKILRLTLDGKPAPGNPNAGKVGADTVPLIAPPRNTEVAKTAPVVSTYTFPTPCARRTGSHLRPTESCGNSNTARAAATSSTSSSAARTTAGRSSRTARTTTARRFRLQIRGRISRRR